MKRAFGVLGQTRCAVLLTSATCLSVACSAQHAEPGDASKGTASGSPASQKAPSVPKAQNDVRPPEAPPSGAVGAPADAPEVTPGMAGPSLKKSEMGARLLELGLDPMKLPKMSELSAKQRYKVMPLIAESLGVECDSCHEAKNYKKETSHKKVARFMWDTMTAPHRLSEGPLFCDSCHQGSPKNLDRSHPKGVEAYMKEEYAGRLLRTSDADALSCATCHGEDFEPDILDHLL